VRQLQKEDATIYSESLRHQPRGALVRWKGLRGFIPGSHISTSRKPKEESRCRFPSPQSSWRVDEERKPPGAQAIRPAPWLRAR